jgi:hypothetical protein
MTNIFVFFLDFKHVITQMRGLSRTTAEDKLMGFGNANVDRTD